LSGRRNREQKRPQYVKTTNAVIHRTDELLQFSREGDMLNTTGSYQAYSLADNIEQRTMTTCHQSDPGKTIEMQSISLSSYVKLCVMISICLGLAVSVLFFLFDVLYLNTTAEWGIVSFADDEMGLVILFVGPFVFAVIGFVGSLLSYRLFQWALRTYWGLQLTGTWKEPGNSKESNHVQQAI
jgi:hypothetical protein